MDDNRTYVPISERSKVSRAVCIWLSTCQYVPFERVEYEYLEERGMTVSATITSYKTKQYIDGSYQAEFPFSLVYRDRPNNADERMKMDEALMKIAEWAESNDIELCGNMISQKVECTDSATMTARYEDGTEEHQITLKLIYEVN